MKKPALADRPRCPAGSSKTAVYFILTMCAVAVVSGLVTLLGWFCGRLQLASLGTNMIPMAPSTAILFLLYGAAIGWYAWSSMRRSILWISGILVGAGTLFALLLFILGCLHIHWAGEHLGLNITETFNGASIGHISPVAAFCFLLAGVSFFALLAPPITRSWRTVLALSSTGLLLGSCFIFLLAYGFGTPLLYGSRFIPPALNTIFAFIALGMALLALAGRSGGIFQELPVKKLKSTVILALIFFFWVMSVVAAGYYYYRNYERQYISDAEQQILAVAKLKTAELVQYRKERLADGAVVFKNASFSTLVRQFFEQPADTEVQRQLLNWTGNCLAYEEYNQIRLLDTHGVTRWSLPANLNPASGHVTQSVLDVLKSGRVTMTDFYQRENDKHIYLSVLIPIFDAVDTNRPLGVLAIRIDPSVYLYPLIKNWPVPSKTAETLLVRREGKEAVFLNEIRFQTNTALNLRIPIESTNTPAVMAVLGKEGIVRGVDYRGMPVFAALHAIPESPWFMVTRRDTAEVFAPMWERLRQTIVLFSSFLFGIAAVVGMLWRQQRVGFYREKAKSAEALYEANEILQTAMNQSSAGIAIADATDGKLRYVNEAGLLIGGSSREQLVNGVGIDQYVASWKLFDLDGTPLPVEQIPLVRALKSGETHSREFIIRRGGHEDRFILAKASPIMNALGQITAGVVVFLDITEQKENMQKLVDTMDHLRVSNRDLEQFAYIASHDLQEPLRMVANYMQLIERRYNDKLDQDGREFIAYAVDGAVRMQQLIDSLLDYSRLQTCKRSFEPVRLETVLQRVLRDLEGRILEVGAQITADPLPQVYGDALQIGLVLQNLISNALKFRGENPPVVHIGVENASTHWKIKVRDNGIGIAPEHQERIFKIFQRLHSRAEYPGTGIGLAICRRIIERHGGRTGVESELRKGSTFWFTLPKKGDK